MLKSPSTFSFTVVLMRVMMFWLLMVASTRYFPSTVMPTTCTRSGDDDVAVAALFDLLPSPQRFRVGARHARRFQKPVRLQPEIELIDLGHVRRNRDRRACAVDVPRVPPVHDVGLAEVRLRRCPADPAEAVLPRRRIVAGLPVEGLLAGPGFPVDGPRVVRHFAARPVDVHRILERLSDRAAVAHAGKRDAAKTLFVDRLRGGGQHRSRIDVPGGSCCAGIWTPAATTRASRTHNFLAIPSLLETLKFSQEPRRLGVFLSKKKNCSYSPSLLLVLELA